MDDSTLRADVNALREIVTRLEEENERLFALLDAEGDTPAGEKNETGASAGEGGAGAGESGLVSWGEHASAQDWNELIDWVDWLLETYQVQQCYLYACWPAHPGIVEDLAALKMAWEEAAAKAAEAGWVATEAMAYWHDRYLPGFFARLHPVHSAAMCTHKHESGRRPTRTDRDCVVVYATGQPLADALAGQRTNTPDPVGVG